MTALLKTTNIQEPSSSTVNLALSTSGGVTVGQNLTVTGTTTLSGSTTLPSSTSLTTPTLVTPNITTGLTLTGAAGTSGQYLTSAGSGSAPTWSTPSAGAMTLISTQTASNSSALAWTGLSGYDKYLLSFENLKPATSPSQLLMQFGTGAGPTYLTSGYYYFGSFTGYTGSNVGPTGTYSRNAGYFILEGYYQINSTGITSGTFNLNGFTSGSYQSFNGSSISYDPSAIWEGLFNVAGNTTQTSNVTAIQVYFSGGNITSGTATLYGLTQ